MVEINLRRELTQWLAKRGHWVVLRRFLPSSFPSEADRETSQQSTLPRKGVAQGRAYVDHVVKSDWRKMVPDLQGNLPAGTFPMAVDFFYMEHTVPVKVDDLILEVELGEDGNPIKPFRIRMSWKVIGVEVIRDGAGISPGRSEFLECRVTPMGARS